MGRKQANQPNYLLRLNLVNRTFEVNRALHINLSILSNCEEKNEGEEKHLFILCSKHVYAFSKNGNRLYLKI